MPQSRLTRRETRSKRPQSATRRPSASRGDVVANGLRMRSQLPPNAAHQRQGKVARILRFAKCVTL